MNNRAQQLIDVIGLQPHPEGGYFKEIHRAEEDRSITGKRKRKKRADGHLFFAAERRIQQLAQSKLG